MNIFEEGSPFQRFLNKVADLLILNLITLVMCVPIITIGAALTAMHYVLLKMVRGEEGYIVKSFFRSFKREFGQATILWILFVALGALMASNMRRAFSAIVSGNVKESGMAEIKKHGPFVIEGDSEIMLHPEGSQRFI